MQARVPGASPQTVPTEVGGRVSEVGAGLSLVEEEHGNSLVRKAKQLLNILFLTLPVHRSCEAVCRTGELRSILFGSLLVKVVCIPACAVCSFPQREAIGRLAYPAPAQICVLMFVNGFSLSNHCVLECASVVKYRGRHDRGPHSASLPFLPITIFILGCILQCWGEPTPLHMPGKHS